MDKPLHSDTALASARVVGMRIDATTCEDATARMLAWASAGKPAYVCTATVQMVMEAHDHPEFRPVVEEADLVTADGMPLAWAQRLLGVPHATRVCGPELMPSLCAAAAAAGVPVGLYGGTPGVMDDLLRELRGRFPALDIVYHWCPPFRPLTEEEDARVVREVADSGARILFVGIGCPKQEKWMYEHRDSVSAVMIGVGAAFDFMAGHKKRAPRFLQDLGLEWLFRLATEPHRLWRRYLYLNPRFLAQVIKQLTFGRGAAGNRD